MTENRRTPRVAARRRLATPEQVRQEAQQSQAKATAQPDRHAAAERRPILHLKEQADEDLSDLETDQPSSKQS